MNPFFAAAVYFVLWWLVLFIVLPIGVRTQEEEGGVEPGTVPSAPAAPYLLVKLLATTLLSGVLFAAGYVVWQSGVVTIDSIPFLPDFPSTATPR